METRSVTQVKVFVLALNHVRDCCEAGRIVAVSTSYDKLVEWYYIQCAEKPFAGDGYMRWFKKESPLYWFNPPGSIKLNDVDRWGHGISSTWCDYDRYREILVSHEYIVIPET